MRAERESLVLSQLDHPNIMAFKQTFRSQTTLFMFAELATGGDLYSLLVTRECFSELKAKWIVRQIVLAVDYMHKKGIAHRDLKLENILCATYPSWSDRIVICDFGHAATRNQGRLKSHVGTVRHQAPELLLRSCEHGFGVDLWAIGVIALKLMTREECSFEDMEPFPSAQQWLHSKLDAVYRGSSISQAGRHFISRCLTLQPKDRITAAEAIQHEWFTTPENDHLLLLRLEEDTRSAWAPKEVLLPTIKELPVTTRPSSKESVKSQVASSYFAQHEKQTIRSLPKRVKRQLDTTCEATPCKLIKCEST